MVKIRYNMIYVTLNYKINKLVLNYSVQFQSINNI